MPKIRCGSFRECPRDAYRDDGRMSGDFPSVWKVIGSKETPPYHVRIGCQITE